LNLLPAMLATLLWGGIVAADTAAFLQLLLSQPFVAGCVTGALWGRLALGCEMGAILQLFALGTLPLGGRTPEDFPIGAVVGVAVAAILDRTFPIASAQGGPILYGLGVAFLVALAGKPVLAWQRRRNERLARWVEHELADGRLAALGRAQWAGVAQAFAIGVAWTAIALAAASLAGQPLFRHQGVAFGRAWHLGSPLVWGFGAGLVTRGMSHGKRPGLLFWIMLVAFLAVRLLGQS
jgi:mannose/fructose/N-acetylgalactosamine-specific phosphotransferase system component IIC